MRAEDRRLLERFGLRLGTSDLLLAGVLELCRRQERLEARVGALERNAPASLTERARDMVARALGRA